ncbi:hypothetical protein ACP70R_006186 [Stipagrostis hirtigluma subsp. patula]
MGARLVAVALALFAARLVPAAVSASPAHISAVISQSGLDFAKDLLVSRAAADLTPLSVPDIERSVSIPLVGTVRMAASGIVLHGLAVHNSTVAVGDTGLVVAASLASANLTMEWSYSYSAWVVTISDSGNASIQLFIDAFSNHIRSSVENAIINKIMVGASKLDSFLGNLPKKIDVDNVAAMNVTFVNDPLFKSSSVEFDIDGLFIPSDGTVVPRHALIGDIGFAPLLGSSSNMLWISLDEDVFNSVSALYFKAGLLQRMVDKIPDQFLLNTASWRFLIPQLYHIYPDDDILLNISAISPPSVRITIGRIDATVDLDITVNVLNFGEIVPVACVSVSVTVSGAAAVSGNNLGGRVELDYFSFTLKWSKVGKLHTVLVQHADHKTSGLQLDAAVPIKKAQHADHSAMVARGELMGNIDTVFKNISDLPTNCKETSNVLRIVLKSLFVPYVNSYLEQGFPLPIIKGFSIRDAYILTSYSKMIVSCDVAFIGQEALYPV